MLHYSVYAMCFGWSLVVALGSGVHGPQVHAATRVTPEDEEAVYVATGKMGIGKKGRSVVITKKPEYDVVGQVPVDVLVPHKMCPPGYDLIDQSCVASSTVPPDYECELGYKLIDGVCYATEKSKAESVCPTGYHKVGVHKCLKVTRVLPEAVCDRGVLQPDGQCIYVSVRDAQLVCNKGFTMSPDGFCFRADKTKPGIVCPEDSTPATKGCVKYRERPPQISCLHGFKLEDGKCVKEKREPREYRCPAGFVLSVDPLNPRKAECLRTVKSEGKEYCEEGTYTKGKCIVEHVSAPTIYCKPGFILTEGRCVRIIEEMPETKCPVGFKYDGVRCIDLRIKPAGILCTEGGIPVLGKCEALITEPPVSACKPGFDLINGECVKRFFKDANLKCDVNEKLIDGKCTSQLTMESANTCDGNSKREGFFCVSYDTVAPAALCAKDEELDPMTLLCSKKQIFNSRPTCPNSFVLQGEDCVRSEQLSVDMICPEGSDMKAKLCFKTLKTTPLVSCKPGFVLNSDGECECVDEIDPALSCPACYTLTDNVCMPEHSTIGQSGCSFKKNYKKP